MRLLSALKQAKTYLTKKKHNFTDGHKFPIMSCKHCEATTGLDNWQLRSMPTSMAECPKGERMSLFERLGGEVDCLPQKN
jgi:hypothetical protein